MTFSPSHAKSVRSVPKSPAVTTESRNPRQSSRCGSRPTPWTRWYSGARIRSEYVSSFGMRRTVMSISAAGYATETVRKYTNMAGSGSLKCRTYTNDAMYMSPTDISPIR